MKKAAKAPENLLVFLGKHPELGNPAEVDEILDLVRQNAGMIAGIGEVGLPYFNLKKLPESERSAIRDRELSILRRFLALAGELRLPVNMHVVGDDVYPCLELLREYRPPSALLHWFVGDRGALSAIAASPVPVFVSVNVDLAADPAYASYAAGLPDGLLLVETDAPYAYHRECAALSPQDACNALAELRREPRERLASTLARNLDSFLGHERGIHGRPGVLTTP